MDRGQPSRDQHGKECGDHQLQVSDFFAYTNWWYRNKVDVPATFQGRRVWLNFDGINYRAFIYVNVKSAGRMDGAFIRSRFNISGFITPGTKNCIAVLIMPVPMPDKMNVKTLSGYEWPKKYPKNGPTILAAARWDWLPTIRDRDMGIWDHVTLTASGDVTIENPFAITHFPESKDLSHADATLKLQLRNHSDQPCKGELKVRLGEIEFTEPVTVRATDTLVLIAGQSQTIREVAPHAQDMTHRRTRFKNYVNELQKKRTQLEHFLFYSKPLMGSLNQACALAGVMHGRASAMA